MTREKAEKFINKYYSFWSDEGKNKLKEMLIVAIKNKDDFRTSTGNSKPTPGRIGNIK